MADNGSKAITAFGGRKEIRELKERLSLMLPGGNKLGGNEILALAQASIAHGLDPMNGEIWFLKDRDGNPRGLMIGIKGLRKKAREQMGNRGNFWIDFREVTDPDERKRIGIPDGALCYEARLFDSDNIRTYSEALSLLTKAGMPWEAAADMMGQRPYTSGYGTLKANEQTRMDRIQCVMKRAEADALKRRFDVPFGLAIDADKDDDESTGLAWDETIIDAEKFQAPMICTCGHVVEEHGIKGACEADGCKCKKFHDETLARNKAALGRDDSGL